MSEHEGNGAQEQTDPRDIPGGTAGGTDAGVGGQEPELSEQELARRKAVSRIETIKDALYSGKERVTYRDRTVQYRSVAELQAALELAESELNKNKYKRRYGAFSRGRNH